VEALTAFEVRVVVGRLTAAHPHLRALVPLVDQFELTRLCRETLQGEDLQRHGWDVPPRWTSVVVASTPRGGSGVIEWRAVAGELRRQVERGGLV
jgi:hypothetical protein